MCSASDFSCKAARLFKKPWPQDLLIAEADGNCCFTVFPFRRHQGDGYDIEPGTGQQFLWFAIKSLKKYNCNDLVVTAL